MQNEWVISMTITEAGSLIEVMRFGHEVVFLQRHDVQRSRTDTIFRSTDRVGTVMTLRKDWITEQYRTWVDGTEIGSPEWN